MKPIAVFGPPGDQEVQAVTSRLINRGVEVVGINLAAFPARLQITRRGDGLCIGDIPLAEIGGAYLRSRGSMIPPYLDYEKARTVDSAEEWAALYEDYTRYLAAEQENQRMRHAVLRVLASRCPVVNPLRANDLHRLKSYLFRYLRRMGLPVPAFCSGTNPQALKEFAGSLGKRGREAVVKPLAGIYKTRLLSPETEDDHPWFRRGALYQQYIPGDTIRCYVIGGRLVAAAKILHRGTVDSSLSQTGIEVLALPREAQEIARKTARVLNLAFCGLDLMREKAGGQFYLIDCNISPMFVNFSRASGIDIPALLVEYLLDTAGQSGQKGVRSLMKDIKALLAGDGEIRRKLMGE